VFQAVLVGGEWPLPLLCDSDAVQYSHEAANTGMEFGGVDSQNGGCCNTSKNKAFDSKSPIRCSGEIQKEGWSRNDIQLVASQAHFGIINRQRPRNIPVCWRSSSRLFNPSSLQKLGGSQNVSHKVTRSPGTGEVLLHFVMQYIPNRIVVERQHPPK
jgi:hypothetical protein